MLLDMILPSKHLNYILIS
uniref:Uncharacterized protein n=1 Tax=Rhizophora mucronata TaxID=61149 RepID=A0A2P2QJX6_RHIMU